MSEFAEQWKRSSFCSDNLCIEVAASASADEVLLRDAKNVDLPVLQFSRAEWHSFTDAVARGEFRFD